MPLEESAYLFTNMQSGDIEASTDFEAYDTSMWHRQPLYTGHTIGTAFTVAGHQYRWQDWVTGEWSVWAALAPGEVDNFRRIAKTDPRYQLRPIYVCNCF